MAYKNKEKERRNKKKYYLKNRKRILRNKRRYYKKNEKRIRGRMQLYGMNWYRKNRKKIRFLHREYYRKNKGKVRQYHKKWYRKNKERLLQYSKEYYQKNREKTRLRHRNYNRDNKVKLLRYKGRWQRQERETNPKYRLDENMGAAIWKSLKDKKAGQKWEILVKYTLEELIGHLEKQFDNRMNWNNYGNYWSVDHIKPRGLFDYISSEDPEFKKCWALENLQPLEKIKNIKKSDIYIN